MKIEVKDDKLLIEVDVSPTALAKAEVSKSKQDTLRLAAQERRAA
jgi:hypothetical protein